MGWNLSFWNTECSKGEDVSEKSVPVDVPSLACFGWTKCNKEITKTVDTDLLYDGLYAFNRLYTFQCLTILDYSLIIYLVFSLHIDITKKQNKINIHFAHKKKRGH